jgi:phage baseplate assembly protein W
MSSLAVLLPMSTDSMDGFAMIKDYKSLVKQNLKMLMLTVPGERIMLPKYGVGLKKYLFSNFHEGVEEQIRDDIRLQVAKYMPVVKILDILFSTSSQNPNYFAIQLHFYIPSISSAEILNITI